MNDQNKPKYLLKLKLISGEKKEYLVDSNEFVLTDEFFKSREKYKDPLSPADIEKVIKISPVKKGNYKKIYESITLAKAILEAPSTYDLNFEDSDELENLKQLVEAVIKLLTKCRRELKKQFDYLEIYD